MIKVVKVTCIEKVKEQGNYYQKGRSYWMTKVMNSWGKEEIVRIYNKGSGQWSTFLYKHCSGSFKTEFNSMQRFFKEDDISKTLKDRKELNKFVKEPMQDKEDSGIKEGEDTMKTFGTHLEEALKEKKLAGLSEPLIMLLSIRLSEMTGYGFPSILDKSRDNFKDEREYEDALGLIMMATNIQKTLSDSDIQSYYIRELYTKDPDNRHAIYALEEDIKSEYFFLKKVLGYRYSHWKFNLKLTGQDLVEAIQYFRKSKFSSIGELTTSEFIRYGKMLFRHTAVRFEGASLLEVLDSYVTCTHGGLEEIDEDSLKKDVMGKLIAEGKESLISELLNNVSFLRGEYNNPNEENYKVLRKVIGKIHNAYKMLMEV